MVKKIEVSDEEVFEWFVNQYTEEIALEASGKKPKTRIVFLTADGVKEFTPGELWQEMQKGTEIGKKNIEIIREWIKYKKQKELEGR